MKFPVRHLFLDLEDTVITPVVEGWEKTECINLPKLRRVIERWKPELVHLFSFAIWNQEELAKFRRSTKPMIEDALKVRFATEWTVDDDILPSCARASSIALETLDFSEMSAFWGKQGAFKLCMQDRFKTLVNHGTPVHVMLLDDVVFDEEFDWPKKFIRGTILNIDELKEI